MANVCLKSGAARKRVVFLANLRERQINWYFPLSHNFVLLENFGANKRKTPPQISVVGFLVTPTGFKPVTF